MANNSHVNNGAIFVFTLLIVVSIIPVPVASQDGGPETVLLDSDAERVAQMEIEGTPYTVYEIDNTLPYASGIEVYSNGRKITDRDELKPVLSRIAAQRTLSAIDTSVNPAAVTSRSAAERQFTAAAWQVSTRELSSTDIRRLREIRDSANRIDRLVSPPLQGINAVLNLFQVMRNTGLFGITVWDVATNAYPQLPQYEDGLTQIQRELNEWNSAAEQVIQNVDPAIAAIQQAREGQRVDYNEVSTQLQRTANGLQQLQSKSNELSSSLSTAGDNTGEISRSMRNSRVPSEFVQPLAGLSQRLNSAAAEINTYSTKVGEGKTSLTETRNRARERKQSFLAEWESERSALENQWQARQQAETRVYGTVGGSGVGLVGLLLIGRHFI